MCRVVDTVLVDQETVYRATAMIACSWGLRAPSTSMNSIYSQAPRYEKARRGELVVAAPVGFVETGDRLEKNPIGGSRRQSAWFSRRVANSAVRVRRFCGSTSTARRLTPALAASARLRLSAMSFGTPLGRSGRRCRLAAVFAHS